MNQGFSIIEFLIAATLGTLIVAAASSVFLTNKSTYKIEQSLAKLQENGRFANYFLSRDIRMAGYQGCAGESFVAMNNLIPAPSHAFNYDKPVFGYQGQENQFTPALPANLQGRPISNSDVIEIRLAENTNVQLRDDMNQPNNPILVYDRLGIQAGEILMISNCQFGDIFIAGSNTNATAITHSNNNNISNYLTTAYTAGAHVMRYQYYAYYLRDLGLRNANNDVIYSLVRMNKDGTEEALVDGVEKMRVEYGVDTNDDKNVDAFQSAALVNSQNNWSKVISVKINLLLATTENVSANPVSFEFEGENFNDRRYRREWQTYITLRNRGLPS